MRSKTDGPEGSNIKCRWCLKASSEIFVLVPMLEVQNADHGSQTQAPCIAIKVLSTPSTSLPTSLLWCSPDTGQFSSVHLWAYRTLFLESSASGSSHGYSFLASRSSFKWPSQLGFPWSLFLSITLCHIAHFITVWSYPVHLFVLYIDSDPFPTPRMEVLWEQERLFVLFLPVSSEFTSVK